MPRIAFRSIQEALVQPTGTHFWLSCQDGAFDTGDPESFYRDNLDDDDLSFDISNNKVLARLARNGTLRHLVFYRGNALVDSHFPGMWVTKMFSQEGPYGFSLVLDGRLLRLDEVDWPYRTGLLDNIFPTTEFRGEQAKITLIAYAPVSEDGTERLRGLIYGALIENTSPAPLSGSVVLPQIESQVTFGLDDQNAVLSFVETAVEPRTALLDAAPGRHQLELADVLGADAAGGRRVELLDFELAPGESTWVPVVIGAVGEPVAGEVERRGTLWWLNQTWSYFRSVTGRLSMPGDPFTAEFFHRAVHQCLECVGMDREGRPVGADLGTSPTTDVICMKDLYYSYLPFYLLEPDFLRDGMLWFLDYSLRPPGNKFGQGGVSHSLGNALTPVILAGLYYASTGDREFFTGRPAVRDTIEDILARVLASRPEDGEWLFPARYISDGPALGDYHLGSNVCAWVAFHSFARILDEVYGDSAAARDRALVAERIRASIERRTLIDGPFGLQYIEGVDADGTVPVMGHEGEESDTTLMPVYGYKPFDDDPYRNYMRFSLSEHNRFYTPHLKGVKFAVESDAITEATFPGYIVGLAVADDAVSMSGPQGAMTEIRRHTDVDGSVWWWPYFRHGTYGQVIRINHEIPLYPGKCGWASGVFVALFVTQILGLSYDGPACTLRFRPFSPASDFTWQDFRLGRATFSASYARAHGAVEVSVTNGNPHGVTLELEVVLEAGSEVADVSEGCGRPLGAWERGRFLGRPTVRVRGSLQPFEVRQVQVRVG